jgi:hypothetical protein
MSEMPKSPPTPEAAAVPETPKQLLANITAFAETARKLLKEGKSPDLGPLEQRVDRFCRMLGAAPTSEREALRPSFIALIDEIGRLESELRGNHAETMRQITQLNQGRRAADAYGNPGGARRRER